MRATDKTDGAHAFRWSRQETETLRDMWSAGCSAEQIAERVGRTVCAVNGKRKAMGLVAEKRGRAKLTLDDEQTKWLRSNRDHFTLEFMAMFLGVSRRVVRRAIKENRMSRTPQKRQPRFKNPQT